MAVNRTTDPKHNWRLRFHLQTETGDITDPNGLCQLDGTYHFFHQHRRLWPDAAHGWGHWATRDFLTWEWLGSPIMPSCELDKNGSYSGSSVVSDGMMWCYYTGNQLLEGDYDHDWAGRLANEIVVVGDGRSFGPKRLVLGNDGYPPYCSCHVRDPKVWEQDGTWHMLLGARVRGDRGAVLLYRSADGTSWEMEGSATNRGEQAYGYMWECPNLARLDGRELLFVCPQGVSKQPLGMQNIHNSGYFPLEGRLVDLLSGDPGLMQAEAPYPCIDEHAFVELDYGFDFYAPQLFEDERGRTILVSWASLPDIETQYDNPTREWTHTFTLPRELALNAAGRVCQWPVAETDALRGQEVALTRDVAGFTGTVGTSPYDVFDLTGAIGARFAGTADVTIDAIQPGAATLRLNDDLEFVVLDGMAELAFTSPAGFGRTVRRLPLSALSAGRIESLRVLADTSIVEIYVNGGEVTLTTRWYPEDIDDLCVTSTFHGTHRAWEMGSYTFVVSS